MAALRQLSHIYDKTDGCLRPEQLGVVLALGAIEDQRLLRVQGPGGKESLYHFEDLVKVVPDKFGWISAPAAIPMPEPNKQQLSDFGMAVPLQFPRPPPPPQDFESAAHDDKNEVSAISIDLDGV
jgi:hypothetical protein